jgi:RHS repeat-associated protein
MCYSTSGTMLLKRRDPLKIPFSQCFSLAGNPVSDCYLNSSCSDPTDNIKGNNINMSFTWDLNGNLITHTDKTKSLNRRLCWDEENRLMAVKDENYLSAYVYDAAGERVWKLTGEVTQMKISGVGTIDVASLSNKTLYVSPYVVYNQQGYSKHYYAGAERVSSRIGGGTMYGLQDPITDTVSPITMEMGYPELSTQLWSMLERSFSDCLDLYTDYITYEPHLESVQASASQNYPEDNWYIYHSDHLGSSSFLTDASGDPTQHLQYLPFGENYIEQRATTDYYTPYTFSAKERDPETGYSYFGARYYDPNVSVWLSVDPLSDKYPSMSSFMYCAGNPVMLVDPDGMKIVITDNGEEFEWNPGVTYEGDNEFIKNTVTSLQAFHDKGLGDVSSSVDGKSGSEIIKGNVLTDFTKGGALYSSHEISITSGEISNSGSKCYCGPHNGQLKMNGVTHYSIVWNQTTGIDVRSSSGKSLGQQSPMIALIHEFGHAWLWARVPNRVEVMQSAAYSGQGDENWILKNIEQPAAKAFLQMGRSAYKEVVDESNAQRRKELDNAKIPYDLSYKTSRYDTTTRK